MKWICPIEKRYHNQLKRCQNERYIAGIKSVEISKTAKGATQGI